MSIPFMSVLQALGYATSGVTVTAIAIWLLLRWCRVQSPTIQRFAWLLTLAPGVVFWRMSMELPVLPAQIVVRTDLKPDVERGRPISDDGSWEMSLEAPMDQPRMATARRALGADLGCVVVLGGWVLGMVMLAIRWTHSYVAFARSLPRSLPPVAGWEEELHLICRELAIRQPIALHVTPRLGPALCLVPGGYRLLVPQAAWQCLSTPQRRAILRHELAHYVRGDLWKSLVARLLALPQWFNPLAWLAVRRFEEAAEWACDDAVAAALGEGRFEYLRALLELGLLELGQANTSTPTLHAAIHGGSLQCRVRRLLSPHGKDSAMKKLVVVVAALALAAGGFARIRLANAQSPAPPKAVSGGAGSASASKDVTLPADDSARLAAATSAAANPARVSSEAFVDLQRVMKEMDAFNQQMSPLQEKIRSFDQECKEQVAVFSVLREEAKTANDAGTKALLEKELVEGQAKFQLKVAQAKKQFLEAEAKIYHQAFEKVRANVAEYAEQHGIHAVRRRSASNAAAKNEATDYPVDTTDRAAILARINRPILYSDSPSESPFDITDAIVQRLNGVKTR